MLLAFLGVAIVVIVTPGQDTALTVRNTLGGGRSAGVRTAIGVVCGQAVWAVAASAGVAALLVASEPAFVALKYAGAAYLIYLGAQSLIAAVRRREPAHVARATRAGHELRQGLLSNLANPKTCSAARACGARSTRSPGLALAALGLRLARQPSG